MYVYQCIKCEYCSLELLDIKKHIVAEHYDYLKEQCSNKEEILEFVSERYELE